MRISKRQTILAAFVVSVALAGSDTAYPSPPSPDTQRVLVEYFYEAGCPECEIIKKEILPQLKTQYEGRHILKKFDVGEKTNYLHLVTYQEKLKQESNEPVSMVVNQKHMLDGLKIIREGLLPKMEEYLRETPEAAADKESEAGEPRADTAVLETRVSRFTVPAVVIAGITDGVNPCAIGTLVFFMSLLSVSKVRGRGLMLMGLPFCLASFLTYTAIGFGLLRVLHLFTGFPMIRFSVEIVMILLLGVFSLLSFRDAYRYKITGDAKEVTLQLPHNVKMKIHKIMHAGLGTGSLVLGGLLIGTAVTALESVCTGQVYVPTLVLVIKEGQGVARAWSYLLLYNAMFILPLVIVFILTTFGLKTETLLAWSKKNVVPSKILLGCFFLAMAALIGVLR